MSIVSNKSYIIHTYKLNKKANDFIRDKLLAGLNDDDKHLFAHVLNGHECNIRNNGWTPIPFATLYSKIRGANIYNLIDLGVIEDKGYSVNGGLCKEYRVRPDLYESILNIIPGRVEDYSVGDHELYNLCNGEKIKKKVRHDIYNASGKKLIISQLVKKGIAPINSCVINYMHVEERLDFLREKMELDLLSDKERLSYLNDERCYRKILLSGFEIDARCYLFYQPGYKGQVSGRRSELNGGFQSCSREQKHEAFFYVPHVRNYDLKSSQIWGLYQQFKIAGIEILPLRKYLRKGKEYYANLVGVSVDCWKGILMGLILGGFPKLTKAGNVPNYADYRLLKFDIVRKHICPELGIEVGYNNNTNRRCWNASERQIKRVRELLQKTAEVCRDLIEGLDQWYDFLVKVYVPMNRSHSKGQTYITNKSDMKLEITPFINEKKVISAEGKRKIAAHVLQGIEAAFISYITHYSSEPDSTYKVLSDQHDGVVVIGSIPDKYVERARLDSDFKYGILVEKPYR